MALVDEQAPAPRSAQSASSEASHEAAGGEAASAELAALRARVAALEARERQHEAVARALRESEEQFRLLAENVPGVIYLSRNDARYTSAYVSDAVETMTGYAKERFLEGSLCFMDLVHPEDKVWIPDLVTRAMNERRSFHYIFRLQHRDGGWRWIEKYGVGIYREGALAFIEGYLVDITDRVRDEQERARLEAQLRQAQKMEAVGTLAGGIAHDFNNLLQSIQSCAELLTLGARGNAAAELFDTILDAVRQGRDLGERLMTFSRRVEPEKMPVDVRRVVDAVWRLAGRTFPKTIRLERADPQGLPPVRANASQIEQVLMNLAINARDAMATGGTLRLETGVVTLPERDARADGPGDEGRDPDGPGAPDGRRPADPLADLAPGRYVFLRVADTGPGIDPAIRDRIFEPFFTTKEAGKGTGLGLAVVYGIVDAHEGRVVLESEPGRGTTFTVYFPALPEAEVGGGATASDGERDRPPRRGQETILVVDDDPSVRNLARLMLSELGYTVVTAADAPEALVAFDGAGHGIDLVLLDLVLPGMNGWQCLEQLRRRDPTVKVLVASGYGPEAPGGGATEIGGFLKKPYAIGDLSRRLRAILDGQAEA